MKRREFIALIGASAAWAAAAHAQQPPTLGLLSSGPLADWAINPFRAGLAEGGYVEGRNLTVIHRSAENQWDRLPALAAELVKSRVSVIFATGSPVPARAAKAATQTIPIVFAYGGDPVNDGIEGLVRKRTGDRGRIVDIGGDSSNCCRDSADPKPAIEHRELDTTFDGQIGAGAADDPGPSDEEHSHEESCIRGLMIGTGTTGMACCVALAAQSGVVHHRARIFEDFS